MSELKYSKECAEVIEQILNSLEDGLRKLKFSDSKCIDINNVNNYVALELAKTYGFFALLLLQLGTLRQKDPEHCLSEKECSIITENISNKVLEMHNIVRKIEKRQSKQKSKF